MSNTTFVVCNFDQPHVSFNVGYIRDHPEAELVALCDENRETSMKSLDEVADDHDVPVDRCYDDFDQCLEETAPDIAFLCPNPADTADWVKRAASHDVHLLVEKPMADTLANADRMIDAQRKAGNRLGINWPMTWAPSVRTVRRLLEEGTVGDIREINYYGGNTGPERDSWFYDSDFGGGSLLDYLGYGVTIATWLRGGEVPAYVTADTFVPEDGEVDEQSVVAATYGKGISTFETTWRSFTDPWEYQTIPANGFVVVGTEGTISTRVPNRDVYVQTDECPEGYGVEADSTEPPHKNVVQYAVDRIGSNEPFAGPTSASVSREGQRIIEAARQAVAEGERITLADVE